jgi:hypothetical protein
VRATLTTPVSYRPAIRSSSSTRARDLVLVVEPILIPGALAEVADPLAKTPADAGEIVAVRLAVGAGEVVDEVRVRSDEAVPGLG